MQQGESYASSQDAVAMIPALRGAQISSLASDGNILWAGVWMEDYRIRLLRINKTDLTIHDESVRFRVQAEDTITDLFINGHVLWIATNHNTYLARPFRRNGQALDPEEAGSFLTRWLSTFDELESRCAPSSLETFLDEEDFAWLGYFKGSVYRYDKRTNRCAEVYRPPSIYEWATTLVGDERFVYIGTRGAGLVVVDRTTLKTITLASAHHPLLELSEVINSLAVDEQRLWVGTDRGLIVVPKAWLALIQERISPSEAEKITAGRAKEVILAIKDKDMVKLSTFIHPGKGIRFSPYSYVDLENDLVFTASRIRNILADKTEYTWGAYDGSGLPIELTFEEYFKRFIYDQDFANATEIGYNRIIGRGNTINNNFEVYPGAIIVEYHFPGFDPKYEGMDWKSLRLVFEEKADAWHLVGIIHDEWTI